MLAVSPVQEIEREWCFFIVDGAVVAGSQYRRHGDIPEAPPKGMTQVWLPAKNVVMDVCLTKPGKYNVVEFNGLISSGFYSAEVGRVVDAIERMM